MMRPSSQSVTASGKSTPIPLDRYVNGYAVSFTMATAIQYTAQYSTDDPYATYATNYNTNGVWFNWDDVTLVNASGNKSTNLAFIPRAIRVNASAGVSAGNPLTITIVPMGMDGN
jgi:hypothetical protein